MNKPYSYDNHTPEEWKEFIAKMHSGEKVEIDESMFYYFLGVLPPVFQNKYVNDYPGHEGHSMKVDFGFAEGWEKVVYFTQGSDERFFCIESKRMNPFTVI